MLSKATGLLSVFTKAAGASASALFSYLAALAADQWYLEPFVRDNVNNEAALYAIEIGTAAPMLAAPFVGGYLGWKALSKAEDGIVKLVSKQDSSGPEAAQP